MRRCGIPKRFQLLGHVITVRILPRSKWRHHMSHELSHDEVFVDQLGLLLQQALTTFEE